MVLSNIFLSGSLVKVGGVTAFADGKLLFDG